MTQPTAAPAPKRGRKPIGDKPMSEVERKRKSRTKLHKSGGREFMVKVEGIHLDAIRFLADSQSIEPRKVLGDVFINALDRFVGVLNRSQRLLDQGATLDDVEAFMSEHLYPRLPDAYNGMDLRQ